MNLSKWLRHEPFDNYVVKANPTDSVQITEIKVTNIFDKITNFFNTISFNSSMKLA